MGRDEEKPKNTSRVRVIIAGSRSTKEDYALVLHAMSDLYAEGRIGKDNIEIVSGACKSGADMLGEQFAKRNGFPLREFPAKWNLYRGQAGPVRNRQMAGYAGKNGILLAFWDGKSRGTENMIAEAERVGMYVEVRDARTGRKIEHPGREAAQGPQKQPGRRQITKEDAGGRD